MANITAEKSVPELESPFGEVHAILAASSTQFFKGQMLFLTTAGLLTPVQGSDTATVTVVGVCAETFLTGAGNTRKIAFNSGIFKFVNSASGIAQDDVGKHCFAIDNQSVGVTAGTNAIAGTIYQVDTDGVFVSIMWPRPNSSPATVAAT